MTRAPLGLAVQGHLNDEAHTGGGCDEGQCNSLDQLGHVVMVPRSKTIKIKCTFRKS
jgi:hypothetical protein